MKKATLVILIVLGLIAMAGVAMAATATNSITVSAKVDNKCVILSNGGPIDFGTYDPTDANPNKTGHTTVSLRCVKGTGYDTYITGPAAMTGAVNHDSLSFSLYSDVNDTVPYPSTTPGVAGSAVSNSSFDVDIYGRIPALQNVSADNYSATVTFTVNY